MLQSAMTAVVVGFGAAYRDHSIFCSSWRPLTVYRSVWPR